MWRIFWPSTSYPRPSTIYPRPSTSYLHLTLSLKHFQNLSSLSLNVFYHFWNHERKTETITKVQKDKTTACLFNNIVHHKKHDVGTKPWWQHWNIWLPGLKVTFSSENEAKKQQLLLNAREKLKRKSCLNIFKMSCLTLSVLILSHLKSWTKNQNYHKGPKRW